MVHAEPIDQVIHEDHVVGGGGLANSCVTGHIIRCLLYTSDAADERSSVDLGGRRIIKKKNHIKQILTSADIRVRNRCITEVHCAVTYAANKEKTLLRQGTGDHSSIKI